jgi:hypothetical protein
MNQAFKAGSCSTSKKYGALTCPVATAKMLKACLGKSIPDVPLGNPTAGTTFDHQRGQMIEAKMTAAGCPVEGTLMAMIPTPSPVPSVKYTVKKNHRGNCPPKDYSGSMCHIESSQEAQEQCSRDKYCRFYVWSGPFGHQKTKCPEGMECTKKALTMPNCMWMCAVVPPVFRSWREGQGTGLSGWESGYIADRSTPAPTPPLVLRQLVLHIRLSGYTHIFTQAGFGQKEKHSLILAVADAADVPATSIKVVEVQDSTVGTSTAAAGGRRLGEAHEGSKPSTKTIIVTVTLTTYDAELERQTEDEVNDGGFAKMLITHLSLYGIVSSGIGVNERISEGPPDDGGATGGAPAQSGSAEDFEGGDSAIEDKDVGILVVVGLLVGGVLVAVKGGHLQQVTDRLGAGRQDTETDEPSAEESQGLTSGKEMQ